MNYGFKVQKIFCNLSFNWNSKISKLVLNLDL